MKVIWLEMFLTIRHDGTDTFWDFWLFFNDYEYNCPLERGLSEDSLMIGIFESFCKFNEWIFKACIKKWKTIA